MHDDDVPAYEYANGSSALHAALGDHMDKLVAGDALDPDRLIAAGHRRQLRRRAGAGAGGALAVLAVAGVAVFGFGHGAAASVGGTDIGAAKGGTPSALPAPSGTAPDAVSVSSGTTDGQAWKIYAQGYTPAGRSAEVCFAVWTAATGTQPLHCLAVTATPDPRTWPLPDAVDPTLQLVAAQETQNKTVTVQSGAGVQKAVPVAVRVNNGTTTYVVALVVPADSPVSVAVG